MIDHDLVNHEAVLAPVVELRDAGEACPAIRRAFARPCYTCSGPLLAHSRKLAGAPEQVRTGGLTGRKVAMSAGPPFRPSMTLVV